MPASQGVIDAARPIAEDIISRKESKRFRAYQDGAGIWTIGRGIIAGVYPGMVITPEQEEAMFTAEMDRRSIEVASVLTREPSAHRLAALQSLQWNIGQPQFASSTVVRQFNAGNDAAAAKAFELWRKITVNGRKVDCPGLLTRRKEEAALYLAPDNAVRPPVLEIPDDPYAAPEMPALVPQAVDPAPIASPIEKGVGMIVSGGGVSGGIAVVSGAADKGAITLAVLFAGIVVLIIVCAAAWWILRGRKHG